MSRTIAELIGRIDDWWPSRDAAVTGLHEPKSVLVDTIATALATARTAGSTGVSTVSAGVPGDPDALDTIVGRLRADAHRCSSAADTIDSTAAIALPAGLVGATGTKISGVVTALVTSLRQESTGLALVADHLSAYARVVRDAQDDHDGARSLVQAGSDEIHAVATPHIEGMHGIFGWDSPFYDDYDKAYDAAQAALPGVTTTTRGMSEYRAALESVEPAILALELGLGDANGYARAGQLTADGVVAPEGMTALDILTLHYGSSPDNPDAAVMSDAEWEAFVERWNSMTPEERQQLTDAISGSDDERVSALAMSALATGAPLAAVLSLARQLRDLSRTDAGRATIDEIADMGLGQGLVDADEQRPGSTNPLIVDGEQFTQEGPTCASTSLLLLGAQSDPFLALIIATGEPVDGYWPPMLEHLTPEQLASAGSAEERFRMLQIEVRNHINTSVDGDMWREGDAAEEPGSLRIGTEQVTNTTRTDHGPESVAEVTALVDSGRPVSVSVSIRHPDPDRGGGHQLVVVGHDNGTYQVYEPNTGVWEVSAEDFANGHVVPPGAEADIFGDGSVFINEGYYLPND